MKGNYLDDLIFEVEARAEGDLFPDKFELYHETLDTIKNCLDVLRIRNRLEIVSVRYYDMMTLRRREYVYDRT